MRKKWVLLGLASVWGLAQAGEVTVLSAGRIHTMDADRAEVEAIAWDEQGRLLASGDTNELLARYAGASRIDLPGKTVIPGLIDAHGHVMGLGYALSRADLVGTTSKQEILQRLQAYARQLPPQAWLLGGGWDQNDWSTAEFPTVADLDAIFPDRPVWLERIDGHAGWANSAALRAVVAHGGKSLAGTWEPEGGHIVRDGAGNPTGVFVDGAMSLVHAVVPPPTEAQRRDALSRAVQAAVRVGLTGVHDMGVSREDLALMREFADAGKLPLRIDAYADGDQGALADLCRQGLYRHPDGRLQMRGVKLYIDGALGSRGAALLADYDDDHGNRGLLVTEPAAYQASVEKARDCGVQVATHAIGDRGNQLVLDTYARVLGDAATTDHRWRIEHAQVLADADIGRFATLGVIASMQPTHATSDMPWAQDRLGAERLKGAYAWQRLLHSGAHLALGSDFPVESPDPRLGLYAAVTRQDREGHPPDGWFPDQRLSAEQALEGFTTWAAWAGFDEGQVGALAPGRHADFVVLDEDPLQVAGAALDELSIRATWVDGRPVYQAE